MDDEDFSEDLTALGAVEALPGRAMTATERTHKRRRKMAWRPKPKSSRRSQRTPGPAVRATGNEKAKIGVVVVGWDWGTGEWAKSPTLLSCGAVFGAVL